MEILKFWIKSLLKKHPKIKLQTYTHRSTDTDALKHIHTQTRNTNTNNWKWWTSKQFISHGKKKITKQTTAEKQTVHIKGITKLYERWKYKVQKYAEEWTFFKFFDFIIVVSDNVDHPPARYPHYNP